MSRDDAEGLLLLEEEGHSDLISFQPTDSDIPSFLEDCNRVRWWNLPHVPEVATELTQEVKGRRRQESPFSAPYLETTDISASCRPSCPGASTRCGHTCRTLTTYRCWCLSSLTAPLTVSAAAPPPGPWQGWAPL